MTTLTIAVPKALIINANVKLFWAEKARRTAALRYRGDLMARSYARCKRYNRCALTVTVTYPPLARRRDASNLAPTVKGLLDGIVDAGLLPDDNDRIIVATTYQASSDKGVQGVWRFELEFTEAKP